MIASVTITSDSATPAIAAFMEKVSAKRLANICRQPLETFTRVHLRDNGVNKRGWPSTGFWEDASRATTGKVVETAMGAAIKIEVAKIGVRQRFLGGPILPVNASMLAIPVSPVAYGHLPREFPGLFLLKTTKGAYLAQKGEQLSSAGRMIGGKHLGGNAGSRLRADLNILFKLSAGVTQAADPSVMPTEDEYTEVAFSAIERSLG